MDQIGFPHQSKNVPIKICHIYRKDKNVCFVFDFFGLDQVYLVSRHIPDRTQRWRGVPFLQYNNKKCFIKFWAINKTEVQKIDVEVEVEVSGWLWLD